MDLLEKAITLAAKTHNGQQDKAGLPYILHPLTLMLQMETETERITAVLHDVVEDSDLTFPELAEMGFSEEVITALQLLTHDPQQPYLEYIAQLKANPLARRVKLADLQHNMDSRRISEMKEKDWARLQEYHIAWRFLQE